MRIPKKPRVIVEKKTCIKCGVEKPISDYTPYILNKDGYTNSCRKCINAYVNKRRSENREESRRKANEWIHKNPELLLGRRIRSSIKLLENNGYKVVPLDKIKEYIEFLRENYNE